MHVSSLGGAKVPPWAGILGYNWAESAKNWEFRTKHPTISRPQQIWGIWGHLGGGGRELKDGPRIGAKTHRDFGSFLTQPLRWGPDFTICTFALISNK
jgi:hypothetical protein